jgi:hypothetical protein
MPTHFEANHEHPSDIPKHTRFCIWNAYHGSQDGRGILSSITPEGNWKDHRLVGALRVLSLGDSLIFLTFRVRLPSKIYPASRQKYTQRLAIPANRYLPSVQDRHEAVNHHTLQSTSNIFGGASILEADEYCQNERRV